MHVSAGFTTSKYTTYIKKKRGVLRIEVSRNGQHWTTNSDIITHVINHVLLTGVTVKVASLFRKFVPAMLA